MLILNETEQQAIIPDSILQSIQFCDDSGGHGPVLQYPGAEASCMSPIQSLPEELLDEILAYIPLESLPTCTLVCRSWHIPASRPVMRTISLNDSSYGFRDSKSVLRGFLAALKTSARLRTLVHSLLLIDMSQVEFYVLQEIMGLLVDLRRYMALDSYFVPPTTPVDTGPFVLKSLEEVIIISDVLQSVDTQKQHMQLLLAPLTWCRAIEDLTIGFCGTFPYDAIAPNSSHNLNLVALTHQVDVKHLRLGSGDGNDEFLSSVLPVLTSFNPDTLQGLYLFAGDHSIEHWNELLTNYGANITTCYLSLAVGDIGLQDAAVTRGRSAVRQLSFSHCSAIQELSLNIVWDMDSPTGDISVISRCWNTCMKDLYIPSLTHLRIVLFWDEAYRQFIPQFQPLVDTIDWRLLDACVNANPLLTSVTIDFNMPAWLNKTAFVGTLVNWHEDSTDFRAFPKDPLAVIQSHVSPRTRRILHVQCDNAQNSVSQTPK